MKVSFNAGGTPRQLPANEPVEDAKASVLDRSIGALLREARHLTDEQVEQILIHQREQGIRFGEAAVALSFASDNDVIWALAQQFHYPYSPGARHDNPELVVAANPFSEEAEAFRELRSQLMMGVMSPEAKHLALAVLSPNIGDGKTYLAANLAIAFSQLGGRTLLVDADMRTPRQHEVFGLGNTMAGLSGILSGRAEQSVITQVPDLPSLYILPAGAVPPNPIELVQRPAFSLLIGELLSKFDHVIVDTPANAHGADARVVAIKCGAALVVGRKGRSRMDKMHALLTSLGKAPVVIAGVAMNEY
jgi:chain length determinant protein tyrosine kinase EpsG